MTDALKKLLIPVLLALAALCLGYAAILGTSTPVPVPSPSSSVLPSPVPSPLLSPSPRPSPTVRPSSTPSSSGPSPSPVVVNGPIPCDLFPGSDWQRDVSAAPVDPLSATYLKALDVGNVKGLKPDFGTVYNGGPNGIQYMLIDSARAVQSPMVFFYSSESDVGPYPYGPDAVIENGSDRHIIALDCAKKRLWETHASVKCPHSETAGTKTVTCTDGWFAYSGATFDVSSPLANGGRKAGWTSADAAGLPILAGLARRDEVEAGEIRHALRVTVGLTQRGYVAPASHLVYVTAATDREHIPMGATLRLKASVDISGYSRDNQVILRALKKYGMKVADIGCDLCVSGAPSPRWNDDDLQSLQATIRTQNFEVIETGPITRD